MGWWKRKPSTVQAGSVLFRGRWAARPEDFAFLEAAGVRTGIAERRPDGGWSLPIDHADWGRATLFALPDFPTPPACLVGSDPRLNEEERAEISTCQQAFGVTAEPRRGDVLSDRKDLLRFLHAILGKEGVAGVDHAAQAFWSRRGLEDELAHDAPLDVDAIYTVHMILQDEPPPSADVPRAHWFHTHGLREIGFRDFDLLEPDDGLRGHAHDLLRALAFATVEGRLEPGGPALDLVAGAKVAAVDARTFLDRTPPGSHVRYRAAVDEDHLQGHVVICDPAPGSWLTRLFRGGSPCPSRFLKGPLPEEVLIQFSNSATDLMAGRARRMLPVLHSLAVELAEFQFPTLVKLGYPVDGGGPDDREHLWFQVHAIRDGEVDATLINAPFNVSGLRSDDRGTHSLELLSDWTVLTPFGPVNPRQTRTLRFLRENRARLREVLPEAERAETDAR
jgi:hypothetical protein